MIKRFVQAAGWTLAYGGLFTAAGSAVLLMFFRSTCTGAEWHSFIHHAVCELGFAGSLKVIAPSLAVLFTFCVGSAVGGRCWDSFRNHKITFAVSIACIVNAPVSLAMGNTSMVPFLIGVGATFVLSLISPARRLIRVLVQNRKASASDITWSPE